MDELVIRWVIGLIIVSLGGGTLAAWGALKLWRPKKEAHDGNNGVPAWVMGLGERLFFTLVIAFWVPGAAIAMVMWITVKMVTGWNRPIPTGKQNDAKVEKDELNKKVRQAMATLFVDLVSMFFALVGGLIAAGQIWI